MKQITYLTTNPYKIDEAKKILTGKYGIEVKAMNPDFEMLEIQAKTCAEVVAFTVKNAADKLGEPVLKSDTGLYIDALGGLPGPYNAYFDKQIGAEKFIQMMQNETNRKARIEHCFGFCEPGKEPKIFTGGGTGRIDDKVTDCRGRWQDLFYIPDDETKVLGVLRDEDYGREVAFWGDAIDQFAKWYLEQ